MAHDDDDERYIPDDDDDDDERGFTHDESVEFAESFGLDYDRIDWESIEWEAAGDIINNIVDLEMGASHETLERLEALTEIEIEQWLDWFGEEYEWFQEFDGDTGETT